jgi:acetyl esterase
MHTVRCPPMARTTLSLIVAFLGIAAGTAEPRPAEPRHYVYKHSAGQPRTIEVFFPPDHDPDRHRVPGIVFFHGGSWTGGTPAQFHTACAHFAGRGIVAATVRYRMLRKGETPGEGESRKGVCVTDAKSAIRWFKAHADELGVDPTRVVAGGGSAGGHLAVLATTTPGLDDPSDPPGVDTKVVAYVLFNPAFHADDVDDPPVDALRHVGRDFAPAIVFFGTEDRAWLPGWDALDERLQTLGNTTTETWFAPGAAHGFFNRPPWQEITLAAADRFLAARGLLTGHGTSPPPAGGETLVRSRETAGARPVTSPARD